MFSARIKLVHDQFQSCQMGDALCIIQNRGRSSNFLIAATLCSSLLLWPADAASGPCAARQAPQNPLKVAKAPQAGGAPIHVVSARDVPTWKTIKIGSFRDSFALRNALDAADCAVGGQAEEILARP